MVYGGVTLGAAAAGIRVVDSSGRYLGGGQALVYTILQAVMMIPPLFLLNGLAVTLSKDKRSLIDKVLGSQVVVNQDWQQQTQKSIYVEDVSRLSQ